MESFRRTSVVIPCFRDDRFLRQTLDSIAAQSIPVREVIVVDDGSPQPLRKPADWSGPELRWIRTANQGLGAARNVGLRAATAEFVAFCDADDWWQPTKLEKQQARLDVCAAAVGCYTWCVDADGYFPFGPYPDPDLPRDQLAALLWAGQFFPPSSVMVRRDAALRVGGFREGLVNGEDLDMWFRLFTIGELVAVAEPLCWYRIHEGQITSNPLRRVMGSKEARRQIIASHADRLVRGGIPASRLWETYRNEILCVYYRRQFSAARPMLWDYWCDHPTDLRTLVYWGISWFPPRLLQAVRGQI